MESETLIISEKMHQQPQQDKEDGNVAQMIQEECDKKCNDSGVLNHGKEQIAVANGNGAPGQEEEQEEEVQMQNGNHHEADVEDEEADVQLDSLNNDFIAATATATVITPEENVGNEREVEVETEVEAKVDATPKTPQVPEVFVSQTTSPDHEDELQNAEKQQEESPETPQSPQSPQKQEAVELAVVESDEEPKLQNGDQDQEQAQANENGIDIDIEKVENMEAVKIMALEPALAPAPVVETPAPAPAPAEPESEPEPPVQGHYQPEKCERFVGISVRDMVNDMPRVIEDEMKAPKESVPNGPRKGAIATSMDTESVRDAYNDIRADNSETTWAVFKYEASRIICSGKGVAFDEFKKQFDNDERAYGYIRLQTGDEMSKRHKFLFVTWIGPGVSVLKRAKMSIDKAIIKNVVSNFAVELQLETQSEFDLPFFIESLNKASGANYGTGVRDI